VPIPFRRDLGEALAEFVAVRPGLRLGRMFGLPAGYAGRRLFACAIEDGLICRLPPDAARRWLRLGARPYSTRAAARGGWVMFKPRSRAAAARLAPALERAARHAAHLPPPPPRRPRRRRFLP
jgi:hypothetical protein